MIKDLMVKGSKEQKNQLTKNLKDKNTNGQKI